MAMRHMKTPRHGRLWRSADFCSKAGEANTGMHAAGAMTRYCTGYEKKIWTRRILMAWPLSGNPDSAGRRILREKNAEPDIHMGR
jgi:hypothetical protein